MTARGRHLVAADRGFAIGGGLFAGLFAGGFAPVLDRIDRGLASGRIEVTLPDGAFRILGGRAEGPVPLKCADLELDRAGRRVTRAGRPVDLSLREFELLDYLLSHRGHLVSREMLVRDVWKEPHRATTLDNLIDVTIARLRKKVDPDPSARLIHTLRGVGFVLREAVP